MNGTFAARFCGAELSGADFSGADIRSARFVDA
ncbi:MAG: pentapeptide repeat-containing protein, partial [Moorea sp. SIO3C2]|nr:pentapeptide repeat-containing protein [Moorena sp. SIO3C2]